jgi:hypothetical protein
MIKYLGYLIAFPVFLTDDLDKYVECGKSLLENGYAKDSIRILAGLAKPLDYSVIRGYILDVKRDLNLMECSEDESIAAFSYHTVEEIVNKVDTRDNLKRLFNLCMQQDFNAEIYDFYLLECALDDLDDNNDPERYWEGLTKDNSIDEICKYAGSWLLKNQLRIPPKEGPVFTNDALYP